MYNSTYLDMSIVLSNVKKKIGIRKKIISVVILNSLIPTENNDSKFKESIFFPNFYFNNKTMNVEY